ncbi:hypothetical protein NC651_016404 [Populus alba x Populus x berolinensis]|nr:hypothetical protein NC651_016404 [Populus alba x Populus x berolinensis]
MLLDGKWYLNIMETKVWLVETRFANTVFVAVPPSLYILCQLVFEFDVFMFTFVTSFCAFAMHVKNLPFLLVGVRDSATEYIHRDTNMLKNDGRSFS